MLKFVYLSFFALLISLPVQAQSRLAYLDLLRSQRQSQIYFEHTFHPDSDSLTQIRIHFRIENDFLNFTKGRDSNYRSEIKATLELYDSKMNIIKTTFWEGKKTVDSYEKTTIRDEYLFGSVAGVLPHGDYIYVLKFQGTNQKREVASERVRFHIGKKQPVWYYLANTSSILNDKVDLINYGGNAIYGKDYDIFITYNTQFIKQPIVKLEQITVNEKDTTVVKIVFVDSLYKQENFKQTGLIHEPNSDAQLRLKSGFTNLETARLIIPNRTFPNSEYRIVFYDGDSIVFKKNYQSFWYDIPLSLLSLDVSISMLSYIMPADKVSKTFYGNEEQKLEQFTKFWAEKDPTPGTDFNELLYEYYKRVDTAFKEYSTPRNPGFETDMGKVFIVYGSPIKKERTYPSNGFVREIWSYGNRSFTFQAASGFGDFQLIK